uniref:ABC transporter D family member 1 n=1 Tax=Tanacetum cinerariifolium TaxID=118510 RepID=A0A6L2NUK3_TANCI|nr:ABC transporter D family member 1 [Tanacetum cinerariifolium]
MVKDGKLTRKGGTVTCCKCGQKGHNKKSYKGPSFAGCGSTSGPSSASQPTRASASAFASQPIRAFASASASQRARASASASSMFLFMGKWVIRAFINLFGSIAINFKTNLLKLGHDEDLDIRSFAFLNGTTMKYVLEQDKAAFVHLIGVSVLQSVASSFVAPSLRHLTARLALGWRIRLTAHLVKTFIRNNAYYKEDYDTEDYDETQDDGM